MFTVILVFCLLAAAISLFVIVYYKYIKISNHFARKLEIAGYILLFIVLIWELVIKDIILDDFYNSNWYYLNQKLHYIFMMLCDVLGLSSINGSDVIEGFTSLVPGDYVQQQLNCVDVIESVLKILSTILIAVGRFQELKNKNAPNNGVASTRQ